MRPSGTSGSGPPGRALWIGSSAIPPSRCRLAPSVSSGKRVARKESTGGRGLIPLVHLALVCRPGGEGACFEERRPSAASSRASDRYADARRATALLIRRPRFPRIPGKATAERESAHRSRMRRSRRASSSSSVFGQSSLSSRDSARSASSLPPVWHVRAVVRLVLGVDDALHRRAAHRARLAVAAVHRHAVAERGDLLREAPLAPRARSRSIHSTSVVLRRLEQPRDLRRRSSALRQLHRREPRARAGSRPSTRCRCR